MPYINLRTNSKIDKEKETKIKERLGEAISILGKSEAWLMVDFNEQCHMYFKGEDKDLIAYIEVKIYGRSEAFSYNNMTKAISEIISSELEINVSNIYVSYSEHIHWGWNGTNF